MLLGDEGVVVFGYRINYFDWFFSHDAILFTCLHLPVPIHIERHNEEQNGLYKSALVTQDYI